MVCDFYLPKLLPSLIMIYIMRARPKKYSIKVRGLLNGVIKLTFSPSSLPNFIWSVPKKPRPSQSIRERPYIFYLSSSPYVISLLLYCHFFSIFPWITEFMFFCNCFCKSSFTVSLLPPPICPVVNKPRLLFLPIIYGTISIPLPFYLYIVSWFASLSKIFGCNWKKSG